MSAAAGLAMSPCSNGLSTAVNENVPRSRIQPVWVWAAKSSTQQPA